MELQFCVIKSKLSNYLPGLPRLPVYTKRTRIKILPDEFLKAILTYDWKVKAGNDKKYPKITLKGQSSLNFLRCHFSHAVL